jgi:hypothetical protein
MTDTPETDAFFMRTDIDLDMEVQFARRLERERNEWKKVAEGGLLGAIRERDEAREALEYILGIGLTQKTKAKAEKALQTTQSNE